VKRALAVALLALALPVLAGQEAEIEYLLVAVANSDCQFIRNGEAHDAAEAAAHLRMKYERAGWLVDDAEEFIDRLASKSSISGRPYAIQCQDAAPSPAQAWLTERLAEYRSTQSPS
jgi:hypothetical protein